MGRFSFILFADLTASSSLSFFIHCRPSVVSSIIVKLVTERRTAVLITAGGRGRWLSCICRALRMHASCMHGSCCTLLLEAHAPDVIHSVTAPACFSCHLAHPHAWRGLTHTLFNYLHTAMHMAMMAVVSARQQLRAQGIGILLLPRFVTVDTTATLGWESGGSRDV